MKAPTPGPWVSGVMGTSEADTTIAYVRTNSSSVIDAMAGSPDIAMVNGEANARLIAAAPDLLVAAEAAEFMLAALCAPRDCDTRQKLRSAIARATGDAT